MGDNKEEVTYAAQGEKVNEKKGAKSSSSDALTLHKATMEMQAAMYGQIGVDMEHASNNGLMVYGILSSSKFRTLQGLLSVLFLMTPFFADMAPGFETYFMLLDVFTLLFFASTVVGLMVMYGCGALFRKHKWALFRLCCVFIVALGLPAWGNPDFARSFWAFRPFVVISFSVYSRVNVETMIQVLWALVPLLVFLMFWNMVFALVGYITLDNTDVDSAFHDYTDSLWSNAVMFLSIAELMSIMNPMLQDSADFYYSAYFVLFTLLGVLMMKLLVGRAMKVLNKNMNGLYFNLMNHRHKAAKQAFHLLATQGDDESEALLDEDSFVKLFITVRPILGDAGARSVFRSLCEDDNTHINFQEFSGCFWVLDQEWTRSKNPADSLQDFYANHHANSSSAEERKKEEGSCMMHLSGFMMFLRKMFYELSTATVTIYQEDVVVLDLCMCVLLAVYIFISPEDFIMHFFMAEILCKLYAVGFHNYFSSSMNNLDFWSMAFFYADNFSGGNHAFLHFLVIGSRLMRGCVLLLMLTSYTRHSAHIIGHILPFLGEFALVYLGGIYVFAMFSHDIYGHVLMNCAVSTCDPLLETTSWYGSSATLNWETATSSYVAQFYTQVTQGWPTQMKAPAVFGESEKNFAKLWFYGFRFLIIAVMKTLGLAMVVRLWKGFSSSPEATTKYLGDFKTHTRSNQIYILRKLYGEAALRKSEGRKVVHTLSTSKLGAADAIYAAYICDRKTELKEVEQDIIKLQEELKHF